LFDDLQQLAESASVVSIIVGHPKFRFQPELRFHVVFFNVNVDRLLRCSFIGVEEKPEAAIVKTTGMAITLTKF
jgi:hypothetical protein